MKKSRRTPRHILAAMKDKLENDEWLDSAYSWATEQLKSPKKQMSKIPKEASEKFKVMVNEGAL